MIKPIMKDTFFLSRKAREATAEDLSIAQDLLDTLQAHREECVGMAANMIGQAVRIIAFHIGGAPMLMLNPEIIKAEKPFETEEGCLSVRGVHKTVRYESICVRYQNEKLQHRQKEFSGWTAQIIQHEIDHCNGILI